ncbi:TPM domain-containing protein [Anaerovibrio sp.]|uniref:TPM domain-containing protein n=1 Tax=Anaerovibrio sp. TaxID=1872532 RepID=UPI003F17890A
MGYMKNIIAIVLPLLLWAWAVMPLELAAAAGQVAGQAAVQESGKERLQRQEKPLVVDKIGVMSEQQRRELEQKLADISDRHNIKVALLVVKKLPEGISIEDYARQYLFDNYRDLENNNGSIVFVQVTWDRKYRVATDANMMKIITDEHGYPYLEERFLDSLKDDEYYQAYNEYADAVDELCEYYEENGEEYDPFDEFSPAAMLLAILLSGGIGYNFYRYLRGKMCNVAPEGDADAYMDKNSLHLTQREDVFLYTSRSVVHHESGGDGGGSDGGGGGDSGGGGGSY